MTTWLLGPSWAPILGRCWPTSSTPCAGVRESSPRKATRHSTGRLGRIRDHYDIHCLIKWLSDRQMLDADDFLETVERTKEQESKLLARMRITRPERDRPPGGYATLNAWTPGTQEHSALSEHYPSLRSAVFGELPTYDEVCETIRSAEGAI